MGEGPDLPAPLSDSPDARAKHPTQFSGIGRSLSPLAWYGARFTGPLSDSPDARAKHPTQFSGIGRSPSPLAWYGARFTGPPIGFA